LGWEQKEKEAKKSGGKQRTAGPLRILSKSARLKGGGGKREGKAWGKRGGKKTSKEGRGGKVCVAPEFKR